MALADGHCAACEKGAKPLAPEKARALACELSGWHISEDGKWLRKEIKFRNFALALNFVNRLGGIAESENHHPDLELGWGYVRIALQTHSAGGLHENDFIMAAKFDAIQ